MVKNALSIRQMGDQVCWRLIQQTMGIRDAKALSDFMSGRVALLLFTKSSLPERLCATAAVRQMSGSTIYQGLDTGQWRQDILSFQTHLTPVLGYFLDCLYLHGFSAEQIEHTATDSEFPVINVGSDQAHPVHALADLACMLRIAKGFQGIRAAWIGGANGTLYSLIEAAAWFPFNLAIAMPPESDAQAIEARAREVGAHIRIAGSPEEAIAGASFVFAGRKAEAGENSPWIISEKLLALASPEVRVLVSATPVRTIPIESSLFSGKRFMLVKQAEYRLCVHKRILHWVFE